MVNSKISPDTKRKTRNTTILKSGLFIAALLVLSIIVTACMQNYGTPGSTNTTTANTSTTNTTPTTNTRNQTAAKVKFSSSKYASVSYLISGDTLDSATKTAIAGFDVKKTTLPDGSIQIDLTSNNPEYRNQTYTLASGQKLYFIEFSLGDDTGNEDFNLKDDTAIIVDADGYIVPQ
jgi:hypothetical protein